MRWVRGAIPLAVVAAVAGALVSSADGSPASCALVASPSGSDHDSGSVSSPFLTAQKLVDSLKPGETGCLMSGPYDLAGGSSGSQLKFNHGGSSDAPITLRSYPGQTAILAGGPVYVPAGSNYVTIADLYIDTKGTGEVGVQIMGQGDQLTGNDITNGNTPGSCIILGSDTGYGRAVNPLVEGNVVHQCGHNPGDPFEDHGVYVDNTVGAIVTDNIFWGMPDGFGVQLYPDSQGTQVTHNVIDDNGNGVVIGGNAASASSNNIVADNVISGSSNEYDVQGFWQGTVGTGNLVMNNCVYSGSQGNVSAENGFTAAGNVTADPAFVNEAAHTIAGYELRPGSPCLGVVGFDAAAAMATSRQSSSSAKAP
ncbi:MAG: right-handed parallel beta-helix repeat-containing protein [Actinomycetota bacterium]|nr:right-handed parallel beta-helix repeat-containing protein [Actinomycetota bacterium]